LTAEKLFDRVAIIGIGLIGSSLARVIRRDNPTTHITACARRAETLDAVRRLGIADIATDDPAEAVADADLVVLATPLSAYADVAAKIAPVLKPGAIVTDVGSVKEQAIADLQPALPPGVHLVPGHPVAGTEHSGPEAGFAEMFADRWCILTPLEGGDTGALAKVKALWELAKMRVVTMPAEHHDKVLAVTSHLPHLIAYTIVGTATELGQDLQSEVIAFSAGGFRDFTRIAASDPVMWRDIFLANSDAVLELLQRFSEDLTALQRAIRRGDGETLHNWFTRTRAIRRSIIEAKQA
jgi:cyclohexadieny/prephenate dehydrogenase